MHTKRPSKVAPETMQSGEGAGLMARVEVDCPRTVSILLDKAPVSLGTRCRMYTGPTVLAVVSEAVDVSAEVRGQSTPALYTVTFITHLVI